MKLENILLPSEFGVLKHNMNRKYTFFVPLRASWAQNVDAVVKSERVLESACLDWNATCAILSKFFKLIFKMG